MKLFVNACVRKNSRTRRLAECLLAKTEGQIEEVRLEEIRFPVVNEAFLNRRDALIEKEAFDDPMFALARQFAEAEEIIIAAPYWDLSFPAALKQYLEQVNVVGITFRYSPEGIPVGLCKAKQLTYITTGGGHYMPLEYGYEYVRALANGYYGIMDTKLYKAEGLDIYGADPDAIMQEAEALIRQ